MVHIDLTGLSNGFNMEYSENYAGGHFPYGEATMTMAPEIIDRIRKYQVEKDLTDYDLKNKLIDLMNRLQLLFSLFTAEEAADIVVMEIHEDKEVFEGFTEKPKSGLRSSMGWSRNKSSSNKR